MGIYKTLWRMSCLAFVGTGVLAALLVVPAGIWLTLAVPAAIAGWALYVARGGMDVGPQPSPGQWALRKVASWYAVLIAVVGLTMILHAAAVLLLAVMAAGSPRALRWYGGSQPTMPGTHQQALSTSDLCREWMATYGELVNAPSSAARLRIVMKRQRCLDELERRDPDGLQAWLASAASAGGDPRRYLTGPGRE
ncbi:hypothetical protein ABZS29_14630 [Kribbella sp. NPDC005582]|uniref:hypothetical protein n=1 Tax=Kribbella sp. NPDC005582 TaxID=3156893 RepID=UPI0033A5D0CE